jgi:hypothetical protein
MICVPIYQAVDLHHILAPVADSKNPGTAMRHARRQAPPNLAASTRFFDVTGFVALRLCIAALGPPPDRPPENRRSHVAHARLAHGHGPDAGHNRTLGQMSVAHDSSATILGFAIGVAGEKIRDLGLNHAREQRSSPLTRAKGRRRSPIAFCWPRHRKGGWLPTVAVVLNQRSRSPAMWNRAVVPLGGMWTKDQRRNAFNLR